MYTHALRIFMLLTIPMAINAAVKIGVSRVKETNEPIDTNVTNLLLTTTTAPAAETTTATTNTALAADNTTIMSPMTNTNGTTVLLQNETAVINATVSTIISNTTIISNLPEFTIRLIRRKFTPFDYYCPCDLKVRRRMSDLTST